MHHYETVSDSASDSGSQISEALAQFHCCWREISAKDQIKHARCVVTEPASVPRAAAALWRRRETVRVNPDLALRPFELLPLFTS